MLVEELEKKLAPQRFITEEEIAACPLLSLIQAEVSLRKYRRLVVKRRWGLPAPTREEEIELLTQWGQGSRVNNGGTPF
jgi:hypothetical protein